MAMLTSRPRISEMPTGSSQPGFRTMSSKVAFGEKKTPITRPSGLIVAARASAIGAGVVAICGLLPPQDSPKRPLDKNTHRNRRRFQRRDCSPDGDHTPDRKAGAGAAGAERLGLLSDWSGRKLRYRSGARKFRYGREEFAGVGILWPAAAARPCFRSR